MNSIENCIGALKHENSSTCGAVRTQNYFRVSEEAQNVLDHIKNFILSFCGIRRYKYRGFYNRLLAHQISVGVKNIRHETRSFDVINRYGEIITIRFDDRSISLLYKDKEVAIAEGLPSNYINTMQANAKQIGNFLELDSSMNEHEKESILLNCANKYSAIEQKDGRLKCYQIEIDLFKIVDKYNCLQDKSKLGQAYFKLAQQLFVCKKYEEAIKYFKKAREYFNENHEGEIKACKYHLGLAHQELGKNCYCVEKYEEAITYFKKAREYFNENHEGEIKACKYHLGLVHKQLGENCSYAEKYEEAITYFNEAIEYFNENHEDEIKACKYHLGLAHQELGKNFYCDQNHELAIEYLNKAIEYFNENHEDEIKACKYRLGLVHKQLGENCSYAAETYEEAITYFKKAMEYFKENHEGKFKDCKHFLGIVYSKLVHKLFQCKKYEEVLKNLNEAKQYTSKFYPEYSNFYLTMYRELSKRCFEAEQYEEALTYFNEAKKYDSRCLIDLSDSSLEKFVHKFIQEQRYKELFGEEKYSILASHSKQIAQVCCKRYVGLINEKKYKEVKNILQQAQQYDTKITTTFLGLLYPELGKSYFEDEHYEEAITYFEEAKKYRNRCLISLSDSSLEKFVHKFIQEQRYKGLFGEKVYSILADHSEQISRVFTKICVDFINQKKYEELRDHLKQAKQYGTKIKLDKFYKTLYQNIGSMIESKKALSSCNDYEELLSFCNDSEELLSMLSQPQIVIICSIYTKLGTKCFKDKKDEEGVQHFKQCAHYASKLGKDYIKVNSNRIGRVHVRLGEHCFKNDQPEAGVEYFKKAIAYDRTLIKNKLVYVSLIRFFYKQKQYEQAIKFIENHSLDSKFDLKSMYREYATNLCAQGQYEKALKQLTQCDKFTPYSGIISILLEQKQYEPAIEYYKKAEKYQYINSDTQFKELNLGDIYYKRGMVCLKQQEHKRAMELFKEAVNIDYQIVELLIRDSVLLECNSNQEEVLQFVELWNKARNKCKYNAQNQSLYVMNTEEKNSFVQIIERYEQTESTSDVNNILSMIYSVYANILWRQKNYKEAASYFEKAKIISDYDSIKLSVCYLYLQQYKQAIEYVDKVTKINKIIDLRIIIKDELEYFYKYAQEKKYNNQEVEECLGKVHFKYGIAFYEVKNYEEKIEHLKKDMQVQPATTFELQLYYYSALEHLNKSFQFKHEQAKQPLSKMHLYNSLVCFTNKKYQKAVNSMEQAINFGAKVDDYYKGTVYAADITAQYCYLQDKLSDTTIVSSYYDILYKDIILGCEKVHNCGLGTVIGDLLVTLCRQYAERLLKSKQYEESIPYLEKAMRSGCLFSMHALVVLCTMGEFCSDSTWKEIIFTMDRIIPENLSADNLKYYQHIKQIMSCKLTEDRIVQLKSWGGATALLEKVCSITLESITKLRFIYIEHTTKGVFNLYNANSLEIIPVESIDDESIDDEIIIDDESTHYDKVFYQVFYQKKVNGTIKSPLTREQLTLYDGCEKTESIPPYCYMSFATFLETVVNVK